MKHPHQHVKTQPRVAGAFIWPVKKLDNIRIDTDYMVLLTYCVINEMMYVG